MEQGFVKVYRELREWCLYDDSKCVHLLIHLMISANHKPNKFFFGGKVIDIQEGQFVTGRKKLSAETGIHESSIERILDKLEAVGEIEQQTNRDNRLITMKKWNKFQSNRTTDEQQANNYRTTTEQLPNTNKNDKNDKNDKKEDSGDKKSQQLSSSNDQNSNCIQTVSKVDTEVRLGKDRLEIDKDSTAKPLTDIQKLVEKMFELAGVTDSLTKKTNFARQTRYAKQLIDEDGFEMAVKLTEMAQETFKTWNGGNYAWDLQTVLKRHGELKKAVEDVADRERARRVLEQSRKDQLERGRAEERERTARAGEARANLTKLSTLVKGVAGEDDYF